ncbi:hypothetical protein [Kitasatospora sp. NPDC058218]|uniref:hypothetical protein n=1 Tax=Kitasatospora sp. NPDC058218 TaxID=3346385 RepID=UPI0036DD5DC6
MTDDQMMNSASAQAHSLLRTAGTPFADRVGELVRAWEADGRDPGLLVTGRPFFALYCWHLQTSRGSREHDAATTAYVASAHRAIGGAAGWNAVLSERAHCSCHGERWRLENLSICLGCLDYVCYQLDGPCCAGAPIVG